MGTGADGERESSLQRGWTVEGRSQSQPVEAPSAETVPGTAHPEAPGAAALDQRSDEGPSTIQPGAARPTQMSNAMVVFLGLAGGIYLLYSWVWLSWAQYYAETNAATAMGSGSVGGVLQQIVFWIAPLAPVLWCITAIVLLRNSHRSLAIALLVGFIVLMPLPMIFARGAAL